MSLIGQLRVGSKIRIAAGGGFPKRPWARTDYVLSVGGNSALTESGIVLAHCQGDDHMVKVLEQDELKLNFRPSRRAWKIIRQTDAVPARETTWAHTKAPWIPLIFSFFGTALAFVDQPVWPSGLWAVACALLALYYARSKDWWIVWSFAGMSVFNIGTLVLLLI